MTKGQAKLGGQHLYGLVSPQLNSWTCCVSLQSFALLNPDFLGFSFKLGLPGLNSKLSALRMVQGMCRWFLQPSVCDPMNFKCLSHTALSHTTLSHTHTTFPCHTRHFHTHTTLSHTALSQTRSSFTQSVFHHLPFSHLFWVCWKKLICGVIRSFYYFFMFVLWDVQ